MLARCLPLLLSLPFTAFAASPAAPGPELLFELYARTLLEGDQEAADTIARTYTGLSFDHPRILDHARRFVPELAEELVETAPLGDLPSGLAERFGSRRLPPELGERFGRQLLNALASTRCQATEDSAAKDATARAAGKVQRSASSAWSPPRRATERFFPTLPSRTG